jgi:hypothetical protein
MNERIRVLAEQAGYTKDMFGVGHWDMPECKKFAELIVRECAGIVKFTPTGVSHARIIEIIKEHFGVEE